MEEYSGYIHSISAEDISTEFTDVTVIYTSEYNIIARAQRYGRWFMLKGLNDKGSNHALARQMLRKEFDILIQMQHPNVVQVLGMEQVEDLGPCIVMEYIDGMTMKERPIEPSEGIRILNELLQAVSYIHSLGIAHRDLKPQNIILTRIGKHVKLIDFGLADTDAFVILKQPAGTIRYMSPEQTAAAQTDLRNDIYSIGVIMSEMPLPPNYQKIWSRCLLPIDIRYQNVEEVQKDIKRLLQRKAKIMKWGVAVAMTALLSIVALLLWRVEVLDNELNRVAYAKTAALEALHEQMERTQLKQHTDTLSNWEYRWPDFMQRVMTVNQFCYDYTDRLDQRFTSIDRDQILETMLSEWQQWQQDILALSTAKVAEKRRKRHKSMLGME